MAHTEVSSETISRKYKELQTLLKLFFKTKVVTNVLKSSTLYYHCSLGLDAAVFSFVVICEGLHDLPGQTAVGL